MKLALVAALALLAVPSHAPAAELPLSGTWSINNWAPGKNVQLTMARRVGESVSKWGRPYPLESFQGLAREDLRAMHAALAFRLARDAGIFVFEGTTTMGRASGAFRFEPNRAFGERLTALGYGEVRDGDLLDLAVRDLSLPYVEELARLGLTGLTIDGAVDLHDRGVRADYLRRMKDSGYTGMSAQDVMRLHDRGISPEYVRGMVEAGRGALSVDGLIRLHDFGVTPSYVARVEAAGFKDLSVDQIVRLHTHGVD